MEIDHLFLFIEPDGPEIEALKRLGLTETDRRPYPGQGTANVCFAFDNLFLELLWITSEAEARSPVVARTRLWERSQWSDKGPCPFGIAVRGDMSGADLSTWNFRPPYLPAGAPGPSAGIGRFRRGAAGRIRLARARGQSAIASHPVVGGPGPGVCGAA